MLGREFCERAFHNHLAGLVGNLSHFICRQSVVGLQETEWIGCLGWQEYRVLFEDGVSTSTIWNLIPTILKKSHILGNSNYALSETNK